MCLAVDEMDELVFDAIRNVWRLNRVMFVNELINPCRRLAGIVQRCFEPADVRLPVVVVAHVLFARPDQLNGIGYLRRHARGLNRVI